MPTTATKARSGHRFVPTKHAVNRYMQRVEQCSRRDAVDRLTHAAEISRPCTPRQISWLKKTGGWSDGEGKFYRFCAVESLCLVCLRDQECVVIITTFQMKSDAEVRELLRQRRRSRPKVRVEL